LRGPKGGTVLLLRHAQTAWSEAKKHTGRTDLPLTDAGHAAARALAPSLAERSFALVLTSPLQRAAQTARLAGLEADEEPALMEWDYGAYEGRRTKEIREERPGWSLWRDGVPDGESPAEVAARADAVIDRVVGVEGDVALVAHGHLLRMLAARWLQQPPDFGARLPLEPAHLGELGFEREARALLRWNLSA